MAEISKNALPCTGQSRRIRSLFSSIAPRYDLANHILSFGLDLYWRRAAVKLTKPKDGDSILDICCGTGDFALAFAESGARLSRIVGCDLSSEMIETAKLKTKRQARQKESVQTDFEWLEADCTATSLESESFDIVSCAFGVRNLADLKAGLAEIYRVARSRGKVCILEFSMPPILVFRWLYLFYLRCLLPFAGGVITGRPSAYRYLAKTVRKWNKEVNLEEELLSAGFNRVVVKELTFGIVTIYVAHKQ